MSDDRRLHAHLIGQQGSRRSLNTPVLVLGRSALDRNIATMAGLARARGVALRPHAKTHKSVDIAKRQIAAGAIGLCCAKLGEAEVMVGGGITGVHITSPVVSPPATARVVTLNDRAEGLMVVVDDPANVAALGRALATSDKALGVIIDVDPGIRRTGVPSAEAAVALARVIEEEPKLVYRGVQFYCGMQQHIEDYAQRRAAIEERTAYLQTVIAALTDAGFAPGIVTGSGTGTHAIDLDLGVFTELQVGSYVFMDRQYLDCDLTGGGAPPFETALFIDTRVVSANGPGMATLDAGFKAMATDGGPPKIVGGADGATFMFMGDEHGAIIGPAADTRHAIGDAITLAAPHCDPTVNLYDSYHVVDGDTLIDIWPVSARGRSR
ncbi:DSD1 family PLP-dependent enzyme [Sphingomonas koreensis]|nr:DSD1 family PLP-dependent enzyme [Sphingomonas koreensis]